MNITDEILTAYADGELTQTDRASVDEAVSADAGLALRLEEIRALSHRVKSAFEPTLAEPVPERLISAVRPPRRTPASVWLAIAATLVIGVVAGASLSRLSQMSLTGGTDGLHARGALAAELDRGRAGTGGGRGDLVQVGLSYRTATGYCRAFEVAGSSSWAGVACRRDGEWIIEAAVHTAPSAPATPYRQAGSTLPDVIAHTIERQIIGPPLDAAQEAAAVASGWSLDGAEGS